MPKISEEELKRRAEEIERLFRERKPIPGHKIHVPEKFSMDITEPLPKKKRVSPPDRKKK